MANEIRKKKSVSTLLDDVVLNYKVDDGAPRALYWNNVYIENGWFAYKNPISRKMVSHFSAPKAWLK